MKIFTATLLVLFFEQVIAQNDIDAIRYSNTKFGSTAKSMSIAGAVGALGADISCASVNPAGLAQFKKSEFSFSIGFVNSKNTSTYLNNISADNTFKMNIPNIGLVFTKKTSIKKGENGWKNFTFSFNMARVSDFTRIVNFQGINTQTSLMDYFAERANGFTIDQIRATDDDFDYGFSSKTSMAWEGYLFDSVADRRYVANANPLFHNISQKVNIQQRGGMNEFNFAIAGNYNDIFYLGATMNYTTVKFYEKKTYAEYNDTRNKGEFSMDNFIYSENLRTTGGGFSGKFGLIIRPNDYFRIGASFQTPTRLKLNDYYDFSLFSQIRNGTSFNLNSKWGTYNYAVVTPFRYTFSAAAIFGKIGFISADIEKVDYSTMRLRGYDGTNAMDIANEEIRLKYTDAINCRIGAEFVLNEYRFRGGFASYASPLSHSENGNLKSEFIAGGIGIKEKVWSLDLAMVHNFGNDIYQPYVLKDKARPQIYSSNMFAANTFTITLLTRF